MKHILVTWPLAQRQVAQLEHLYHVHRYDTADPAAREAMLTEFGAQIDAIATNGHFHLDRTLLDRLPAITIVACSSAGYESVDTAALAERGIAFTNTSAALTDDVADTAIMLMLAARRNLIVGDAYVRTGDWGRRGMLALTHRTAGSKAGIVGLGQIGQAIATRCAALNQEVAYHTRRPRPEAPWRHVPELVDLARWADVLIAITPGGPETRGLISAQVIDALGPEGTFVNVSRGSVVDEPALIAALQEGRLGAAGLDVFATEPTPDPAFATLPNVVLYPHHASGTVETRDAMAQLVVDNLAAHFAGRPLLTPVT
jgi:lactate dehydrogenase-like 2-hydroxyacid dehydrogenase